MEENNIQEKRTSLSHNPGSKHTKHVLVIHGGAGPWSRSDSTPEKHEEYRKGLEEALRAGDEVLRHRGEALDAVVAAVAKMEDNPIFNCGKGAVFNRNGKIELETGVMLSKPPASHPHIPATRRGLAVTLLTRTRNPSRLVRALYLHPELVPHTTLSGATAEDIGASLGEVPVDPSYFYTENRWREHRKDLGLPEEPLPYPSTDTEDSGAPLDQMPKGTVGAVALDVRGCIATLTSTGGWTNKIAGRVGDTPTMGAGFWAEEWIARGFFQRIFGRKKRAVGVAGTGDGDHFVRQATAVSLAHRIKFLNEPLAKAAEQVVEDLQQAGGFEGAIISLDETGHVSTPQNSKGMYRGVLREGEEPKTAIFHDDILG